MYLAIVYKLPGNKVRDLFNGKKEPGFYELNFGGEKQPSGLYVYRIEAGDFISSRKNGSNNIASLVKVTSAA